MYSIDKIYLCLYYDCLFKFTPCTHLFSYSKFFLFLSFQTRLVLRCIKLTKGFDLSFPESSVTWGPYYNSYKNHWSPRKTSSGLNDWILILTLQQLQGVVNVCTPHLKKKHVPSLRLWESGNITFLAGISIITDQQSVIHVGLKNTGKHKE